MPTVFGMRREAESFIDVIPILSAEMVLEGAGVDGEVARRDLERCYHVRGPRGCLGRSRLRAGTL